MVELNIEQIFPGRLRTLELLFEEIELKRLVWRRTHSYIFWSACTPVDDPVFQAFNCSITVLIVCLWIFLADDNELSTGTSLKIGDKLEFKAKLIQEIKEKIVTTNLLQDDA